VAGLQARRDGAAVTWIGHATVLLQLDGLNILSDPHFSERASPVSFAGPKRHQPPGVSLAQLPHIDVVMLSHNHYDHLDLPSVRALMAQAGGPPLFLVPLGVAEWFAANVPGAQVGGAAPNVRAFDWDDHLALDGRSGPVDFRFLAVQHWSSRTPWDRNATLWGSWAVRHPQFRYWFSGDLGYSKDTQDIGRQWGPFDFAAIAVGAYAPRWFMARQHIDPTEAVQVMEDIGARAAFGIHWGTFSLTDEPLDQPPRDLAAAVAAKGWAPDRFGVLRHGETRVLKNWP
jgi:L-ascorbate metabolism protein UlaG (beta-lactamase superfamily)